jgi:Mg-chelatase subunit ChlD
MANGTIYVDGTLIENDDDKLDILAGLSIHEKLHLVHTKPLTKWERDYSYSNNLSPAQERLLHNICNIIEDEYIESQLAKTHAGYTMYIEKVKEHFFGKHGHKIDEMNGNPIADIMNTLLAMVRYPQSISADRRKKHSKHIQFFARALKDALTDRHSTFMAMDSIYCYMNQLAKEEAKKHEDTDEEEILRRADERLKDILEDWGDDAEGMSDKDIDRIKERLIKQERDEAERSDRYARKEKLSRALEKFAKELADYSLDRDTISDELANEIDELADSDYSEEKWDVSRALGLKQGGKVTWRNQKASDYDRNQYNEAEKNMKSAIGQLKRKIQLYGDTRINTIRNQRRGKLDKRMLHKIPLGRPDLFKNVIIDEDKPLDVCLLVDESGSMGSWKMAKARETAIALRESLKDNQALNLWVFGHTADGYDWDSKGDTNMSVYWSPTYKSDIKAMGAMRARSENRDGMAILASAERVKAESPSLGSNKLMIVISDGEPSADKYRFPISVPHTKKCVRHIEGQGWNVIQIGISGARERIMKDMFSNYIMCDDTAELPTKVSKVIRRVIKV